MNSNQNAGYPNYGSALQDSGVAAASPPEFVASEYGDDKNDPDGRRLISGAYADGSEMSESQIDYPVVGYVSVWRDAIKQLGLVGKHSDASLAAVAAGGNFDVTFDTGGQLALGFEIDWSTSLQTSQPFQMAVSTIGFVGAVDATVDPNRNMTLYTCNGTGGKLFIPFGQRETPSMSIAMPALTKAVAGNSIIRISGVPAGLTATFGFTARLMTAWSLSIAAFSRRAGIFTGTPRRGVVCARPGY